MCTFTDAVMNHHIYTYMLRVRRRLSSFLDHDCINYKPQETRTSCFTCALLYTVALASWICVWRLYILYTLSQYHIWAGRGLFSDHRKHTYPDHRIARPQGSMWKWTRYGSGFSLLPSTWLLLVLLFVSSSSSGPFRRDD